MTEKYQRFGKYLILDHLVDGGMAKICIANYLGEQANKIVAIKMVQPQYSKNASFIFFAYIYFLNVCSITRIVSDSSADSATILKVNVNCLTDAPSKVSVVP